MARRVQRFGGQNTVTKQQIVGWYLAAYTTALRKTGLHLSYIDAFCGAGWRVPAGIAEAGTSDLFGAGAGATAKPRASTAVEALAIRPPFDRYVFGDTSRRNLDGLEAAVAELKKSAPETRTPEFFHGDANELVRRECRRLSGNPRERAVMFLDPFGMQVDWTTLQAIERSRQVDLWLLVPTGIGVARMLPRNGPPEPKWEDRLDRFLGTTEWRAELYTAKPDLLGHIAPRREANLRIIVDFIMRRFGTLFGQGLHRTALPLRIRGRIAYHLIFVCCSPNASAREIAFRIAGHLLDRASQKTGSGN